MLTRKMLSAMGIESEKIEQIIAAHAETVTALNEQIDAAKAEAEAQKKEAERLQTVEKELESLKAEVKADAKKREGKDYDALKQEFDTYKAEQEKKAVRASKESAYREILKDAGIPEKHFAKILKYSDVDGVELDEKGRITTAKDLIKTIKEEWADHIETQKTEGAPTVTPPGDGGGKKLSRDEIMKTRDPGERQRLISENMDVFGY